MSLPRRPFLGLGVTAEPSALRVTRVIEGATGAAAGLRVDDRVLAVERRPVADARALVEALTTDREVELAFERAGEARAVRVRPVPFPAERIDGAAIEYDDVIVRGARWRTIGASPPEARDAILFVAGLRCASIDFAGREGEPLARFFAQLARAGIATLRLERGGLGDSEGPPCRALDLETELEGYRAALAALRAKAGIAHVFLFAHSVGGMIAPLLDGVDGRVVYGSSAERWSECLAHGARRQLQLGRRPEAERDARARALARFEGPELEGRPRAFHEQLEALDLEAAWAAAAGTPLLVLIGEHDWVAGEDAQRRLAALGGGEARILRGVDHGFTAHASLADSLRAFGRGAPARSVAEETIRFVRATLSRR